MKRITTVLRESEAMAVRKAVCIAGGECVVITAMPQRLSAIELGELCGEQPAVRKETRVWLEVTVEDRHYDGIVSAILRMAHAGKIILSSHHDGLHRCAA